MPLTQETREHIIKELHALINKRLPVKKAKLVNQFADLYFQNVSTEGLNERTVPDLYGAMISHWDLIGSRRKGETKLNVYNPQFEQHGWQSIHTIIELATDDMPFLVDSLCMEINKQGFGIHFMIHQGAMRLRRDAQNLVTEITVDETPSEDSTLEAPIYIEIDRETDPAVLEKLQLELLRVLKDVRLAVEDWSKIRERMHEAIQELTTNPAPTEYLDIAEAKAFLAWLDDDHFTYLGCRDYELVNVNGDLGLRAIQQTGLGVLRKEEKDKPIRLLSDLPPAARELAMAPQILVVSKTNTKATVHRPVYTDYIGVKRFDKSGNLIGERRFIGLYTSTAYKSHPKDIPLLRRKVEMIMQTAQLSVKGHSGKELMDILASLPRDDLFQANTTELSELAIGILHIQERPHIHLFVRQDTYRRFISCLVYVPREQLDTELRLAMQDVLMDAFKGLEITFTMFYSESILARVDYLIRTDQNVDLKYNVNEIETKLIEVARSWSDELRANLIEYYGEDHGSVLMRKYLKSFPASYRDDYSALVGIHDIEHMERLSETHLLEMNLHRPLEEADSILRFKLFRRHEPVILSDALPMLENMGLRVVDERPYEIILKDGTRVWIHDFGMTHALGQDLDIVIVKDIFQEAFIHIWQGAAENDGFNRLIMGAQLTWREAALLRAYAKYLRQVGFTFSQVYIESTLAKNAHIAKLIIQLFKHWFDPLKQSISASAIPEIEKQLQIALDAVANLDEDRILRRLLEVVRATFRTNYFQVSNEGKQKPWFSFKLNPARIADLPLPRPMYEVFVYSPRVEAIHLRAAKVARGGIRWSDRREDFRTEVLGLMKAQQVKNSVIVPAGAKGGFVPKCLPEEGTREVIMAEVVSCYQTFIRGLLDVTDNLLLGHVQPPANTVCYDNDDPYLVVAADKGTATFSDIANSISADYQFWLGDAFASGGSAGYDHKKMGITARGAWESVKRHFRTLNIDPQAQDFTVVGIGDMAGDVFGNGMLLSRHIKLVAAFNHMHIFLDPNPNPEMSFAERQRLFDLPRSTWEDYNADLISKGGGVFKRSAKVILLSPEVKELLGLNQEFIEPNALIRCILTAKVDLLWNGGIGTYVKATNERHVDVGDRTNDAVRVNGDQLRSAVVAEGGNLGFTQLGRVEYSLNDGLIYTDFIDNSAGVDCSDHEVNSKILLNMVVTSGDMTVKQRNQLLAEMTDEIAELVLDDNYSQTGAINLIIWRAAEELELHRAYISELEQTDKLDRALEFLPDDKTLLERKAQGKGLCSPEIAIILSYSKMSIKNHLLHSDLLEDPYLGQAVALAFPKPLRERYRTQMELHSLRREIVATQLSNAMVNDMGITFAYRMQTETGATIPAIVRAYTIASAIYKMPELVNTIEKMCRHIDAKIQYQMIWQISRLVRRAARWFLRSRRDYLPDIADAIAHFTPGISQLSAELPKLLVRSEKERWEVIVKEYCDAGVHEDIAMQMASVKFQYPLLDIVESALENNLPLREFAMVYFSLGEYLEFSWLREQINNQIVETNWDALARSAMRDDLDVQQRKLSIGILQGVEHLTDITALLDKWVTKNKVFFIRWQKLLTDLRAFTDIKYMMLSVVVRELVELVRARFKRIKRKPHHKAANLTHTPK